MLFKTLHHFPFPPAAHEGSSVSASLPSLVIVCLFDHGPRTEVASHCGFICISLTTNDSEHLLICLWAIYISSLEKYPFYSSTHLKNRVFQSSFRFTRKLRGRQGFLTGSHLHPLIGTTPQSYFLTFASCPSQAGSVSSPRVLAPGPRMVALHWSP